MCGIVGAYDFRQSADDLHERVRIATAQLVHRGPDDGDVTTVCPATASGAAVVFGHRRLAIIDLSPAGHQPMRYAGTGDWITYNGEIYNYLELRRELFARGHAFRSQCDTEVILAAYAEWGVGCLRRLRGIFAFGIWDHRRGLLLLARDHMGVKPLYYHQAEHGLWFGSETRSLLASEVIPRTLDGNAVVSYLKYGSVQEPLTLIQGVRSLSAGNYLLVNPRGHASVRQFWGAHECLAGVASPATSEDILAELAAAVDSQMVADVPIGVFLSSGIDSTTIAMLASTAQRGDVRTFCVGFEDEARDERAGARAIAEEIGCRHTDLFLEGSQVRRELPEVLRRSDLPSSDGLNTYYISKAVREAGIKVALTGLGGDELFAGYDGFRKPLLMQRWARRFRLAPRWLRVVLGELVAQCVPVGMAPGGALVQMLVEPEQDAYFASRVVFAQTHINRMLHADLPRPGSEWQQRELELFRHVRNADPVARVSYLEFHTYMLSTLLRDADQMSMCHGLELRVPLIDPILLERVLPLAAEVKLRDGRPKALLVQAVRRRIDWNRHQRPKRGFELPVERWVRGELRDLVEPVFQTNGSGIWKRGTLPRLWRGFASGTISWPRLWTVFMLETWLRQHRITP